MLHQTLEVVINKCKYTMKNKLIVFLVILVIIANVLNSLLNFDGLFKSYHFQSKNKEFEFLVIEGKGRNIDMMNRNFEVFKKNNQIDEPKIYRTFERNAFKFWKWYEYLNDEIYSYPYLDNE